MSGSGARGFWTLVCEWRRFGKPSSLGVVTGMVAGLGTITPASGFVRPMGALTIGTVAGLACSQATILVMRKLKLDARAPAPRAAFRHTAS